MSAIKLDVGGNWVLNESNLKRLRKVCAPPARARRAARGPARLTTHTHTTCRRPRLPRALRTLWRRV